MSEDLTIGLDIGGTKMAFVVADRQGTIHETKTLPTNSLHGVSDTLERIIAELNSYLGRYGRICGIGIGVPGPVDTAQGVALHAANLGWENVPLGDAISSRLSREMPIYVENDVNVGAIGEQLFGNARGVTDYVYLTVGTGLGGAVMINNSLLRGASHSEMELGHVSLDPVNGRQCTCGQRGCVEMSISGKGIVANARQHIAAFAETSLCRDAITTHNIVEAAEASDPLACFVLDEAADALAIAFAWCISMFNPKLIVLGGGLIHASYHLLQERTLQGMRERCLPISYKSAEITLAKLTDAALGASALVPYYQSQDRQL